MTSLRSVSRAASRIGLAALFLTVASRHTHTAIANGDTRTISFHHLHTNEDLTVTYKVNGRYDAAALKKIDWLMRDWRRNEAVPMDPHLIDAIWEAQREVGGKSAIQVVCGYRAPATNSMLRRRSSGVAQHSQHTLGKAIDFYIPDANLDNLRAAGLRLQRGGVGFYPGSGWPFVHMDVGSVRHWPRMTYEQLAKVFPDGRTVHVPSNGQPLKNYALALADLEKRGGSPSANSLDAARVAGVDTSKRTTLANLFGFKRKPDRDETEVPDVPAAAAPAADKSRTQRPNIFASTQTPKPAAVATASVMPVPMPKVRPAMVASAPAPVKVAAVEAAAAAKPARPAQQASVYAVASAPAAAVPVTPNEVISSRGFWQGLPEQPMEASAARRRVEVASADTQTTGSIGPWTKDNAPDAMTFAYANPTADSRVESRPQRAAPMGKAMPPRAAAVAAGTTVALKATATQATQVQSALTPAQTEAVAGTSRLFDNPWLRATVSTPSVAKFMSTSLLGAPDLRTLQPLLRQPTALAAMSFSDDPYRGLSADRFRGPAVVFVATVVTRRAVALQ